MANDIEINVRVANETGTGLTSVNAAMERLRRNAREASQSVTRLRSSLSGVASLDVNLDDRTGAGIAAVRASLAELRAERPVRLEAEFRGDSTEIAATAAAMRTMRTNAGSANTALTALSSRALAAAAALTVLKSAAQEASNALRTLRGRAAATATAMQDLRNHSAGASSSLRTLSTRANSANGRMETLATRTHALTTNMDGLDGSVRRVGGGLAGLRGNVGSLGSSLGNAANGSQKLLMAAIALAPAIVPIAAAVAPLVPAMTSAGAAAAAFGAALIPQILALGKIGEAQKAYKQAVTEGGHASKAAADAEKEWLREVTAASPEVRKAAASLGIMKEQYAAWSDSLAGDTLPVATKSFAILGALFPKLTPLVKASSAEFGRLTNILAVGVQSKGLDELIVKMADFTHRTLRSAVDGIVSFGQAASRGVQSDGFREFLAYVRESGPLVAETLGNLMRAMMKIVVAASDTGVGVLTVVNAFARLVNAVPTELLGALMQAAFAFKALQLASTALGPSLAAAATGAANFTRAARFGGVASAIQGVTASLSAMQKASIALAVIAAVVVGINELAERAKGAPPDVDRLTTSLKNLGAAGKFTGELQKTFVDMDGFIAKANNMRNSVETFDRARPFTSLIPMGAFIEGVAKKLDNLGRGSDSLTALQDQFKGLDEAFSSLARGGHADEAATQFARFEEAMRASGRTTEEIAAIFPQYQAAVAGIAADQEMAARSMGVFGEQAVAVQAKLDLQKQSAEGLRNSINALNEVYLQARGGVRGMEAAIDAATESLKNNGRTLDENTEKGRANNQALDNIAGATMKAAEAALVNGQGWEAAQAIWERGRGKLLESAQAMGLTEAQARALADQVLATPDKTAYLRGNMEDLQAKLKDAQSRVATAPLDKQAAIRAEISDLLAKIRQAQAATSSLSDQTVYIRTIYQTFREQHHGGQADAHGGVIGAAGGGPRSRMTLVGEQGPELVDLAPGSRVRSNPDSKRIADGMAGGGGGGGVLEIRSSGSRVDDLLLEILRGAIRVQGGDVQLVLGSRNR